ncbi:MAG: threonine synthase [Dehalococcoidales bacterium]|nr:threonine synthase [Dehalococcoidales bacterium]
MKKIRFYSTNNKSEQASFKQALMNGLASDYGLYMIPKTDIPNLAPETISSMKGQPYAEIAFRVLNPFLEEEIPVEDLKSLLESAYDENIIPTKVQPITGKTHIMWLTNGPTYSFKDYAARFYGRMLNYFLEKERKTRVVVVATSGDTGGAVADALHGLERVSCIVFFPKARVSEHQRRQMTTLGKNVYAVEVNGDFDTCQAIVKRILGDKAFSSRVFDDPDRFTSANSISVGRLLPQAVYPFYAYSRVADYHEPMIISIPSGNFGNMMGSVIAKAMGLPISKILCGVNENTEFADFMTTWKFQVKKTVFSPSVAMNVSNPSNFARLIDFYGGHVYDKRDENGQVIAPGVMDTMPDIEAMKTDLFSISVSNENHYRTMKEVYERYGVIIEPHGAVGWKTLEVYLKGNHNQLAVIDETADPAKFPDDILKAIGKLPDIPENIRRQEKLDERMYHIDAAPDIDSVGSMVVSTEQYERVKGIISEIFP